MISAKKTAWLVGAGMVLTSTVACESNSPAAVESQAVSSVAQAAIVGSRVQAESWSSSLTTSGAVFNEGGGDGQSVAGFQVNEHIGYASVNFGSGANQIQVAVGAPYGGGKADIWLDNISSGTKLGTLSLASATGSDWNTFVVQTVNFPSTISGTHTLYFNGIATGGDWLYKLDYFELYNTGTSGGGGGGGGGTTTGPSGTVPVVVKNNCPFNLNVLLTGVGSVSLEKDSSGNPIYRNLAQGASYTYFPPGTYPSGRVSAYKTLPSPTSPRELEKAEFTLGPDGNNVQNIYYNLTYVDHLGLPMQISATGGGSGCQLVQCNKSYSTITSAIANTCPDGLRYTMGGNTICLAPRSFCTDGEYASDSRRSSICSRLDSEVARCATLYPGQCNPGSDKTAQVYACSGNFFATSAKFCSAITRGMLDNPDSTNVAQYYNTGKPYSTYAKWIHDQCGAVYGFPYDDYPMAAGQAGFFTCNAGKQLNVTFCPAG